MDWTNETVLEFIELYQSENLLWDPRNKLHKNRNLVADAWERIRASLSVQCTVADLKKKRESLMTTFRLHLNKKKKSIKSGAGADEIYHTNWFAYSMLEGFLGPVYKYTETRCTETAVTTNESTDDERQAEISQPDVRQPDVRQPDVRQPNVRQPDVRQANVRQPEISQPGYSNPPKPKPITGKRKLAAETASGLETAKKQMDDAFNIIQKAAQKEDVHECDLYCQFLAKRLKQLDPETRDAIMMEIDAIIYNYRYNKSVQPSQSYMEPVDSTYHSTAVVQSDHSQSSQQMYQFIQGTSYQALEQTSKDPAMEETPKIKILSQNIIKEAYNLTSPDPLSPDSILPE